MGITQVSQSGELHTGLANSFALRVRFAKAAVSHWGPKQLESVVGSPRPTMSAWFLMRLEKRAGLASRAVWKAWMPCASKPMPM